MKKSALRSSTMSAGMYLIVQMINTNKPINTPSEELCNFIVDKLGISKSALELGVKRSFLENSPLPIVMWSYGLITLTQLNEILEWQKNN